MAACPHTDWAARLPPDRAAPDRPGTARARARAVSGDLGRTTLLDPMASRGTPEALVVLRLPALIPVLVFTLSRP
jgi:hypothetical protein